MKMYLWENFGQKVTYYKKLNNWAGGYASVYPYTMCQTRYSLYPGFTIKEMEPMSWGRQRIYE